MILDRAHPKFQPKGTSLKEAEPQENISYGAHSMRNGVSLITPLVKNLLLLQINFLNLTILSIMGLLIN